jgi:protocatechuate 3,4-dioxygenase beta subunit
MKRRTFTRLTGLSAIALSTTGFIKFDGESYVGDCETTTDILGPFYRPDSPVRDNLVVDGEPGDLVELSGIVRHKDCKTPYKNAKIELWHCSADEVYDNDSDAYLYRGTTFCDEDGRYSFRTQMPVPYDVGNGTIRPAHFHMMVSAQGYQSLVTQIYFTGDPYVTKDATASLAGAKNRILDVHKETDMLKITFDCNMSESLRASHDSISRLIGQYKNEDTGQVKEVFEREGLLWLKNEVFGVSFNYAGKSTFEYPGLPQGMYRKLKFHFNEKETKLQYMALEEDEIKRDVTYSKI